MKICPICGCTNKDSRKTCTACGNPLSGNAADPNSAYTASGYTTGSDYGTNSGYNTGTGYGANGGYNTDPGQTGGYAPQTGGSGTKKSGNTVKILLIALGAVLLIAAAVLLFTVFSPKAALYSAGKTTLRRLPDAIESKSDLVLTSSVIQQKISDGKLSAELEWDNDYFYLFTDFDYSRPKKLLSGSAQLREDTYGLDVDVAYSIQKTTFEVRFSDTSLNVYGCDLEDLSEKLSSSSSKLPINLFKNTSGLSVSQAKKNLQAFIKAVEVEKKGKTTVYINNTAQNCKVYELTWSEKSAEKLTKSLNGGISALGSKLLSIFSKIEPELTCYVNGSGEIVCVDFVYAANRCSLYLKGTDNPWDSMDLTVKTAGGSEYTYSGGIVRENDTMRISLTYGTDRLFELDYDTDSGTFVLNVREEEILQGKFLSDGKTYTAAVYDDGELGTVQLTVSRLKADPERLAKKYIDILDMSLTEWQKLILDVA